MRQSGGPPWILGQRGVPLEAPENTLASFQRAFEAGAQGLHFDLRAAGRGEAMVMRDASCLRTAEVPRQLAELALPELSALDVGAWFSKDFVGEPVPHLDEVLVMGDSYGQRSLFFIELHDRELIGQISRSSLALSAPLPLRVGSVRRDHCLELRDAGLKSLLMTARPGKDDLAFARDERLAGVALTSAGGWQAAPDVQSFAGERWALGVENAKDLMDAMVSGCHGITTSEVRRALSIRELLRLVGGELENYPLHVSELPVPNAHDGQEGGEWRGDWQPKLRLRNPFAFPVRVGLEMFVRRGAFEAEGLPVSMELAPGEEHTMGFRLRGGSWSPGGDPLLAALFEWDLGPGRKAGRLLLDATLRRVRRVDADGLSQRVQMLREQPGQARATMTVMRRTNDILLRVENPGGLTDVSALASLQGQVWSGASSLRIPLPPGFDDLASGIEFTCGFEGRAQPGAGLETRRWCGGLPAEPRTGGGGWLVPLRKG